MSQHQFQLDLVYCFKCGDWRRSNASDRHFLCLCSSTRSTLHRRQFRAILGSSAEMRISARDHSLIQIELPLARAALPERAAQKMLCRPVRAGKADAMCKDLVNAPRSSLDAQEGVAMVSFLGAGGKEITVECPKVIDSTLHKLKLLLLRGMPCLQDLLSLIEAWEIEHMSLMFNFCWKHSDLKDLAQDQYILDAGLDAGVELPYTCRGGICGWAQISDVA